MCSVLNQTKEEIAQRNIKSRMVGSQAASSKKRKEPASALQRTESAGEINQNLPQLSKVIESKQITFQQFTESDRRNVLQKFLSSQEVLFLIYGLMFPT